MLVHSDWQARSIFVGNFFISFMKHGISVGEYFEDWRTQIDVNSRRRNLNEISGRLDALIEKLHSIPLAYRQWFYHFGRLIKT